MGGNEEEEISMLAISEFRATEEEIEKKKTEVREKVKHHMGRAEEETRRLTQIWEELKELADPTRKEAATVRKKIEMANRELKSLGQSCQKKEKEYRDALQAFNEKNREKAQLVTTLMEVISSPESFSFPFSGSTLVSDFFSAIFSLRLLTESENLRMKKLEELRKNIECLQ